MPGLVAKKLVAVKGSHGDSDEQESDSFRGQGKHSDTAPTTNQSQFNNNNIINNSTPLIAYLGPDQTLP